LGTLTRFRVVSGFPGHARLSQLVLPAMPVVKFGNLRADAWTVPSDSRTRLRGAGGHYRGCRPEASTVSVDVAGIGWDYSVSESVAELGLRTIKSTDTIESARVQHQGKA
jgi:hypothetical protein